MITSSIFTEIGFFQTVSAAKKTVCIRTPTSDPKYIVEECCTFEVDEDDKPTGSDATCRRSICPVGDGKCSDIPSKIPTTSGPLKESGVLEEPTTLPNLSQSVGPTLGGVLEQLESNLTFSRANISSSNSSNNTMPLEQSDLVSDTVEKTTRNVDDGEEEQDESGTTEEAASEQADEAEDEDKNDEEESPP